VEGRWTPEDLLLGAVASCYTTTFRALADNSKFEYVDFGVEVEGTVNKAAVGYAFGDLVIRPNLTITNEEHRERALRLLEKTKTVCLVSRALCVGQTLEPQLQIGEKRALSRQD
jgi:organic hydroperoxide reductase OsmC/OhrA